jgi:hypothetical protein
MEISSISPKLTVAMAYNQDSGDAGSNVRKALGVRDAAGFGAAGGSHSWCVCPPTKSVRYLTNVARLVCNKLPRCGVPEAAPGTRFTCKLRRKLDFFEGWFHAWNCPNVLLLSRGTGMDMG